MDCKYVQNLLISYIDTDLPEDLRQQVKIHLFTCPLCAQEFKAPVPQPGFQSRFWTRLAQKNRGQTPIFGLAALKQNWCLSPIFSAGTILTIFLFLGISSDMEHGYLDKKLSTMPADEAEMVKNLDLAQYWQGIEHMDVSEDNDTEGET